MMLSVCDAGHGGRAKELTRLGIASGAGKAARSLSRYVKENRTLVVTSVCAIVLVMLLENVLDKENIKLDAAAWWLFGEQLRQPWLTPIMESFSALATPVTLLVVLGVAAAFTPVKRPGWCNVLNLGLVVLLNQAMCCGWSTCPGSASPRGIPWPRWPFLACWRGAYGAMSATRVAASR